MDVMLIMMKSTYFKKLKESLRQWFPKEDTNGYVVQIKVELKKLLQENKGLMEDKISRYYGFYVLFVVAVHTVIKDKYSSQESFDKDLLDLMYKLSNQKIESKLQKARKSPNIYKEFISMSKYYIKKNFDNKHFGIKVIEDSDRRFRYRVNKCLIHKILSHLGVPELTRVFCEADKFLVKGMEDIVVTKNSKLIGNGDEYCDWCFEKKT